MSLHDIHEMHKVHLHDTTRFSVVLVRAALKRTILIAYERQMLSIGTARRIINALRLQGA